VTYGHLGSPEELCSGEGTAQPLLTLSISFSTGWGSGFVPEAEERARPPVIGWLGVAADEQTLTWLHRTMGDPCEPVRGLRTPQPGCAAAPGSAVREHLSSSAPQRLLKRIVQRETR